MWVIYWPRNALLDRRRGTARTTIMRLQKKTSRTSRTSRLTMFAHGRRSSQAEGLRQPRWRRSYPRDCLAEGRGSVGSGGAGPGHVICTMPSLPVQLQVPLALPCNCKFPLDVISRTGSPAPLCRKPQPQPRPGLAVVCLFCLHESASRQGLTGQGLTAARARLRFHCQLSVQPCTPTYTRYHCTLCCAPMALPVSNRF
jgi:hypothetical protein